MAEVLNRTRKEAKAAVSKVFLAKNFFEVELDSYLTYDIVLILFISNIKYSLLSIKYIVFPLQKLPAVSSYYVKWVFGWK